MCQILYLPKGIEIPEEKVVNSVTNNPHGWGGITKNVKNGTLKIHRVVTEDTKPQEILDYLDKHKNHDRYVHMRWRTEGEINQENCHPFEILKTNKSQVFMMHNGTFNYPYRPKHDDKVTSDTKMFADNFLIPLFQKYVVDGEQGVIDDMLKSIIDKHITGTSRVMLIRNNGDPVTFGSFVEVKSHTSSVKDGVTSTESKLKEVWANSYSHNPNHRSAIVKKKTPEPPQTLLSNQKKAGTTSGVGCEPKTEKAVQSIDECPTLRKTLDTLDWCLSELGLSSYEDAGYVLEDEWATIQKNNPEMIPKILSELSMHLWYCLNEEKD